MYGKVKGKKIKRRSSLIENTLVVLVGVMCFFLAGAAHERGIAVKWDTALFATVIPFSFVIYFRRKPYLDGLCGLRCRLAFWFTA
jgi:hypothetical protein